VRNDLAMTGEITLRGRVFPIGGLKEKALAAHRVGIKNLIVPKDNEKDLAEIPPKIRAEMTIQLVEMLDEVLATALLPAEEQSTQERDDDLAAGSSRGDGSEPQPGLQEVTTGDEAELPPPPADSSHEQPVSGV